MAAGYNVDAPTNRWAVIPVVLSCSISAFDPSILDCKFWNIYADSFNYRVLVLRCDDQDASLTSEYIGSSQRERELRSLWEDAFALDTSCHRQRQVWLLGTRAEGLAPVQRAPSLLARKGASIYRYADLVTLAGDGRMRIPMYLRML